MPWREHWKSRKEGFWAVGNGYKPPQNLYFIHYFYSFSVLSPLACFDANSNVSTHRKHTTRTFPLVWFNLHVNLKQFPSKKSCYHQGFFAVKRRAVFILGAKWVALVRGWRRDCVVGGMETRFQWRKAHSRTAKCEAFHVAPRLFFMFLFLIPFTIRQQCIIYPQEFSNEPKFDLLAKTKMDGDALFVGRICPFWYP
mgnify:CR=1 FL=1